MTTKLEQAARQLLIDIAVGNPADSSLTALREALAEQAEQEPVAWWNGKEDAFFEHELCGLKAPAEFHIPLYAAPVQQVELTDDEIDDVRDKTWCLNNSLRDFARAVIAADREKNK